MHTSLTVLTAPVHRETKRCLSWIISGFDNEADTHPTGATNRKPFELYACAPRDPLPCLIVMTIRHDYTSCDLNTAFPALLLYKCFIHQYASCCLLTLSPLWSFCGPFLVQLVDHGTCNATHTSNVCTHDCKSLWVKLSAQWNVLLLASIRQCMDSTQTGAPGTYYHTPFKGTSIFCLAPSPSEWHTCTIHVSWLKYPSLTRLLPLLSTLIEMDFTGDCNKES